MNIADFIGEPITSLFEIEPFNTSTYTRSVDMEIDKPCIDYIFQNFGVEIVCNLDEKIRTIFLSKSSIGKLPLINLPFTLTREEVTHIFGKPHKSGVQSTSLYLGSSGAWDRFRTVKFTIHVEYKINSKGVNKVTLMSNDSTPG